MNLEEVAKDLQARINATIESRCRAASPLQWRAIADDVAEKLAGPRWEYVVAECISPHPPTVHLTRYLSPEPINAE